MCNKLEERKQAMLMYHVQYFNKAKICHRLKHSRPWLDRWLGRYDPGDVEGSLSDQGPGPNNGNSCWSTAIRH